VSNDGRGLVFVMYYRILVTIMLAIKSCVIIDGLQNYRKLCDSY
jgi:hypothetical protein